MTLFSRAWSPLLRDAHVERARLLVAALARWTVRDEADGRRETGSGDDRLGLPLSAVRADAVDDARILSRARVGGAARFLRRARLLGLARVHARGTLDDRGLVAGARVAAARAGSRSTAGARSARAAAARVVPRVRPGFTGPRLAI